MRVANGLPTFARIPEPRSLSTPCAGWRGTCLFMLNTMRFQICHSTHYQPCTWNWRLIWSMWIMAILLRTVLCFGNCCTNNSLPKPQPPLEWICMASAKSKTIYVDEIPAITIIPLRSRSLMASQGGVLEIDEAAERLSFFSIRNHRIPKDEFEQTFSIPPTATVSRLQ